MELELRRQTVPSFETILEETVEQPVECDALLPDYCPDIRRILKCTLTPVPVGKTITAGRLEVEGLATLNILYISAGGEPARGEYKVPFTRMLELRVTDQSFHRELMPPDIDFPGEIPPLFRADCRLHFESRLAYRVYDEFLPEDVEILPDGRLEVRVSLPADDWLYGYLLSFGTGVEVLEPESLRQRLAAMGVEIFRKHSES